MKEYEAKLSAERLRGLLSYDPETGMFVWVGKTNPSSYRCIPGKVAGKQDHKGYVFISINGRRHFCHRLAWCWMTGRWPNDDIDHINLNKSDNRWSNLREATAYENKANTGLTAANRTGIKGVNFYKAYGKYSAEFKFYGKKYHLGYHSTIEEAASRLRAARERICGEFARHA